MEQSGGLLLGLQNGAVGLEQTVRIRQFGQIEIENRRGVSFMAGGVKRRPIFLQMGLQGVAKRCAHRWNSFLVHEIVG